MPAKENKSNNTTTAIILSDTHTKLIRKDVDTLVQNIKDNLKLTYDQAVNDNRGSSGGMGKSVNGTLSLHTSYPPPTSTTNMDNSAGGSSWPPASSLLLPSRKARSCMSSRGSRASPYSVPVKGKCDCGELGGPGGRPGTSSWAARKRYPSMSANGSKPQKIELDDPLEMLQELISEGNLLKEAVRRLQLGLTPKIQRKSFYDSDEEGGCRSPTTTTTTATNNTHTNQFTDICEIGIN